MSQPHYLRSYLAAVLRGGKVLQMRDPNDNAKHRYQWAWVRETPCRRRLPERGDFLDTPAEWEPVSESMQAQIESALIARRLGLRGSRIPHPIIDYFCRTKVATTRRGKS